MNKSETASTEMLFYREKFKIAPLGVWRTEEPGLDNILQDFVIFHPDGTGEEIRKRAFGDEDRESFNWRPFSERCIEIYYPNEEQDNSEDTETRYAKVKYDFQVFTNNFGISKVGMIEEGENGFFFFTETPLFFVADSVEDSKL